jgi:hypothetical protein
MHHLIGTITVGALAGVTTSTGVRQSLLWLVKGGIVAKRKLQAWGATTVAEAQRIVDEARADLDRPALDQPATERPAARSRRGVGEGASGERRG